MYHWDPRSERVDEAKRAAPRPHAKWAHDGAKETISCTFAIITKRALTQEVVAAASMVHDKLVAHLKWTMILGYAPTLPWLTEYQVGRSRVYCNGAL